MLARNGGTCSCSSSRRHHHTAFSAGQLATPVHSTHRALSRVRVSGGNGSNGAAPQSFDDDADSGLGRLRFNKRESELPKELQGLEISEDGSLIDTKNGKVINEFGATRFDVAVRALLCGELDPAPWVENTERNPGVLLTKLVSFPTPYTFQVVGKTTPEAPKEQFVADMVSLISSVCEAEVAPDKVEVKDRLGGKYASVSIEVVVRAPEMISSAYERIGQDGRVKMKF